MSWNIPIALNLWIIIRYRVTCGQLFIHVHAKCDRPCQSPIVGTRYWMLYMVHFQMLMFRNMQCIYGLMLTSHVQMKMWEFNPHVWQILFYIYYSLLAFYIWWCESLDLYKKNCSKKSKWTLSRNEWIEPNLLVG